MSKSIEDFVPSIYSASNDFDQIPRPHYCGLDSWYQMLSLLYMLFVYVELIIFIIFACSILAYMKRFFMIVDDIPSNE